MSVPWQNFLFYSIPQPDDGNNNSNNTNIKIMKSVNKNKNKKVRKQKDDMQVNVAGIRRNIKNLAHNYSDAQVKVREATSNDPWGPSATIMAEIADLTYNVVAFSEIMQMIWKRLNDHGKNWRHVYKALIVLEYLIKTGTEKVAQQCKENIFAIHTLREFVYYEDGKDQGVHVREKAKQLVLLLRDEERLKNERTKALKAKERFAQHASGFGSDGYIEGPTNRETPTGWPESEPKSAADFEFVRPQTAGEEELQLQLAMAMSREEAEQEEAKRRSDDVRLQLALSQSEQDFKRKQETKYDDKPKQSHLMDLLDISLGATSISGPSVGAGPSNSTNDPWGTPARAPSQLSDPWSGTSSPPVDPWQVPTSRPPVSVSAVGLQNSGDAWIPHRNQSPSIASGSSTEGWLQNRSTPTTVLNGNPTVSDPWLSKGSGISSGIVTTDPWLNEKSNDKHTVPDDPWKPKSDNQTTIASTDALDPWAPLTNNLESRPSPVGAITSPASDLDEFDVITNRNKTGQLNNSICGTNNNNSSILDEMDPLSMKKPSKTPQSFLGENSSLVNLDNLIKPVVPNNVGPYNPFSETTVIPQKTNLFQQQQTQVVPSINQLKQQPFPVNLNQDPWAPVNSNNTVGTGTGGTTITTATQQFDDYLIDYDSDQIIVCTNKKNIYPYIKSNNNQNDNDIDDDDDNNYFEAFDFDYLNNSLNSNTYKDNNNSGSTTNNINSTSLITTTQNTTTTITTSTSISSYFNNNLLNNGISMMKNNNNNNNNNNNEQLLQRQQQLQQQQQQLQYQHQTYYRSNINNTTQNDNNYYNNNNSNIIYNTNPTTNSMNNGDAHNNSIDSTDSSKYFIFYNPNYLRSTFNTDTSTSATITTENNNNNNNMPWMKSESAVSSNPFLS